MCKVSCYYDRRTKEGKRASPPPHQRERKRQRSREERSLRHPPGARGVERKEKGERERRMVDGEKEFCKSLQRVQWCAREGEGDRRECDGWEKKDEEEEECVSRSTTIRKASKDEEIKSLVMEQ